MKTTAHWSDPYEFSIRAINVLIDNKVESPAAALALGYDGLRAFKNCGVRTAREIIDTLSPRLNPRPLVDVPTNKLIDELEYRGVLEPSTIYTLRREK